MTDQNPQPSAEPTASQPAPVAEPQPTYQAAPQQETYQAAPQPAYAEQSAYAAQQPVAPQPVKPTNVLAIITIIAAFVMAPVGIVTGHISLSQIKRTGEEGRGLAKAGLILSYIFTAFMVIGVLLMVLLFVGAVMSAPGGSMGGGMGGTTGGPF